MLPKADGCGSIGVESEPEQGSTFWFEFPLVSQSARAVSQLTAVAQPPSRATHTNVTVLYIEDTLSNVRLVERLLAKHFGLQLLTATDGACELVLAETQRPDVILLDLHLPDMSGTEVLVHLRSQPELSEIPVIVLSADACPSRLMACWQPVCLCILPNDSMYQHVLNVSHQH